MAIGPYPAPLTTMTSSGDLTLTSESVRLVSGAEPPREVADSVDTLTLAVDRLLEQVDSVCERFETVCRPADERSPGDDEACERPKVALARQIERRATLVAFAVDRLRELVARCEL